MSRKFFQDEHGVDYIRSDFPTLKRELNGQPLVYFDSAASALKPQRMIDAVSDFYAQHYSNVHRGVHSLSQEATSAFEAVREQVCTLINAPKTEQIIFNSGTTEGINFVAKSFTDQFCQAGDVLVITEMEHHANIVSWQLVAQRHQLELQVVPVTDEGELDLKALQTILQSGRVKLLAVCHISNILGTINPVKQMAEMVHAAGAKILVDGAQSIPHMPIDVQDLDVDFFTFSAHKLFGPTGVGVLYGRLDLLEAMQPISGGGDMIDVVTFEKTTYNDLPHKFEPGTPNIAGVIGLGASLDYLDNIGIAAIEDYEHELTQYMLHQLQNIEGLRLLGPKENRAAVFSFVLNNLHHLDIGTLLNEYGIAVRTGHHCGQPLMQRFNISGTVRASLAFYNKREEIDFFITKLQHIQKLLM